jgi:TPP-dependent pyruvate/acetoin dehydrogenase alpha subunit
MRVQLLSWGILDDAGLAELDRQEVERIEAALIFAEASPEPDPEDALSDVFPGDPAPTPTHGAA